MCQTRLSVLIHGWVYFESCADTNERKTEWNPEKQVYLGL